ncbi:MAG: dienelactone hydrolase family protein [Rhodospirillales bacterium]|jgi:carboxymethylenebutenolidase|nr:dienelactone hydrolase family protein [Rhodospirillales bacterium]MDP6643070.1 dienelactone hydrolase family protein [Rhodospirillales bacterium]MDP6841034.1 dienelactone hydrolase family protein [Rhodospirillales bacterium]|tara:strand:+ start:225 stop:920 length:696 start_codon:yes stop_codon:yes gene_type:complete
MPSENTTVPASGGGNIPTYISTPESGGGPGVVIIPSIMGVASDIVDWADRLAAEGFVVSATDPFWRDEDAGNLEGQENARERGHARMGRVDQDQNMSDLEALLDDLKARPECNGKVAVMGFCFGGSYAFLGAARLGTGAGIAFHSGKISHLLDEAGNVNCPLSYHWGDDDAAAPMDEIEKVQAVFASMENAEVTVYPGGKHGFMQPTNPPAYDEAIATASWNRALEILKGL